MVARIPVDERKQQSAQATLHKQASDLVQRECKQYIESTKLIVEANRLSIEAHRIRLEARDLKRQIWVETQAFGKSLYLDGLEARRQVMCCMTDELQAQAVQLLTEAMRMRSRLMIPRR